MRNVQGTAEVKDAGDAIVSGLGRVESAERVGAGIEGRVIVDGGKSAVVETPAVRPSVAKGLVDREPRRCRIVNAAVDQEAVGRLLVRVLRRFWYFGDGLIGRAGRGRFRPRAERGDRAAGGSLVNFVIWSSGSSVNSHLPGGSRCRNGNLGVDGREALHLDFNVAGSIREVSKGVEAALVSHHTDLFRSLCNRHGSTRKRQATEGDLATILRSRG